MQRVVDAGEDAGAAGSVAHRREHGGRWSVQRRRGDLEVRRELDHRALAVNAVDEERVGAAHPDLAAADPPELHHAERSLRLCLRLCRPPPHGQRHAAERRHGAGVGATVRRRGGTVCQVQNGQEELVSSVLLDEADFARELLRRHPARACLGSLGAESQDAAMGTSPAPRAHLAVDDLGLGLEVDPDIAAKGEFHAGNVGAAAYAAEGRPGRLVVGWRGRPPGARRRAKVCDTPARAVRRRRENPRAVHGARVPDEMRQAPRLKLVQRPAPAMQAVAIEEDHVAARRHRAAPRRRRQHAFQLHGAGGNASACAVFTLTWFGEECVQWPCTHARTTTNPVVRGPGEREVGPCLLGSAPGKVLGWPRGSSLGSCASAPHSGLGASSRGPDAEGLTLVPAALGA
mmetsp:Transcript_31060/g.98609  ORF Transcript_31060/g.98609 Transcript_31060/m.98609 type:complete len:402 (+) Transcript_31060:1969-3174(+)